MEEAANRGLESDIKYAQDRRVSKQWQIGKQSGDGNDGCGDVGGLGIWERVNVFLLSVLHSVWK